MYDTKVFDSLMGLLSDRTYSWNLVPKQRNITKGILCFSKVNIQTDFMIVIIWFGTHMRILIFLLAEDYV